MQRLISIWRRPLGIFALVSARTRPYRDAETGDNPPYRQQLVPLAAVSEAVCPWRDKDVKAWRSLARVPGLSRRAGVAIVRAIIGSVADPDTVPDSLPPLSFAAGPADVRPYLCAPESEQQLLDSIGEVLDEVSTDRDFPTWHWRQRAAIAELPDDFRRSFLWGLHLSDWKQVELTLAVYEALELEEDPALRLALARLLSFADRPLGIEWARRLVDLEPSERLRTCEWVLETGAYRASPKPEQCST